MTLALCAPAQAQVQERILAQPRIINGNAASQGEYPAQGVLRFDGDFICGGTLVSNRYFLTAAHCVTDNIGNVLPVGEFSVTLGSVNRDSGQLFTFSALDRNADYDPAFLDNDSALFTLSTPAPATLEPMRLIEEDEIEPVVGRTAATVIGWGGRGRRQQLDLARAARGDRADADRRGLRGRLRHGLPPGDDGVRRRRQHRHVPGRLRRADDGQRRRVPRARRPDLVGR